MTLNRLAAFAGYSITQLLWRLTMLENRRLIKWKRGTELPGGRGLRRREVRIVLHLKELETRFDLRPLQAIRFLDRKWRQEALQRPRLWR